MPTETGTAFLVDPMGHAPDVIDGAVHKILLQYLNLPDGCPASEAVEWLLLHASENPNLDDREVLSLSLWHYTNTPDHDLAKGILASARGAREIEDLTTEETKILQDTLVAIRRGGWFPEWLSLQVNTIANGSSTIPEDRYPTPLTVASSLVDCVREHEEKMQSARDFARMRPDLIMPAAPALPEPTAAKVAAGPTPAARRSHRPTRKSRKKVSHAA